jgi:hypothetical protein
MLPMKSKFTKLIFLSLLFFSAQVFSQNKINDFFRNNTQATISIDSLFTLRTNISTLENTFSLGYAPTFLAIDTANLKQIRLSNAKVIELTIPQNGKSNIILELFQGNVLGQSFKVNNSQDIAQNIDIGIHYMGRIKGNLNSLAAISFFENGIIGMISDKKNGDRQIKKSANGEIVMFEEKQLLNQTPFECFTAEKNIPMTSQTGVLGVGCKVVNVYIEADNQYYVQNGSSITATANASIAYFNQVAAIYAAENIEIALPLIKVWDILDPYNHADLLTSFRTILGASFPGNLAHLFVGTNGGGVAYVGVLNSKSFAHGLSSMTFGGYFNGGYTTSPVGEIAHELGHNFGSNHTHSCTWAGGPIDNCYTPEGSCAAGPAPTSGGTVMSYCHLLNTVGINLANGFGVLPGNLIRANVIAALLSPSPAAPSTVGASNCNGASMVLTGANCTGGTIKWYAAASGGIALGTGLSFNTPIITANTTYYASCTIGVCESATRTPTNAEIILITGPVVTNISKCGSGIFNLFITGCTGGVVNWYNAITAGTLLRTGPTFPGQTINATTTYYISCTLGTCTSTRVPMTVTINALPTAPIVNNYAICGPGIVNMTASCPGGGLPTWYAVSTTDGETTILATANMYSLNFATTTTIYVSCANALCSASLPVTITVNPLPAIPVVISVTIPTATAANLVSTACTGVVNWYSSAISTAILGTGTSFVSPVLSSNTTYFFDCTVGTCLSTRGSSLVTVSACPANINLVSPTNTFATGTTIGLETSGIITAQNIITGGNVKYDAAQSITLSPGFKVNAGAVFRALIDGCGGAF